MKTDLRPPKLARTLSLAGIIGFALCLHAWGADLAIDFPAHFERLAPDPESPNSDVGCRIVTLARKLDLITIPKLELRGVTLGEAVERLRAEAQAADLQEPEPARRRVNFVLHPDLAAFDARFHLSATDVKLSEAVRSVTALANVKFNVATYAVEIVPLDAPDRLTEREWKLTSRALKVPPGAKALDLRGYFIAGGILFPPGTFAVFAPTVGRLFVRNTERHLDAIDQLVASAPAIGRMPIVPYNSTSYTPPDDATAIAKRLVWRKLHTTIIPKLEFRHATMREAIDRLEELGENKIALVLEPRTKQVPVDRESVDYLRECDGFPLPRNLPAEVDKRSITISLTNIPLGEALRHVTKVAGLEYRVTQEGRVEIVPFGAPPELTTREYPEIAGLLVPGGDGKRQSKPLSIEKELQEFGLTFPAGASGVFTSATRTITLTNTQANHDLLAYWLDATVPAGR